MIFERLCCDVQDNEGFRATAYRDSLNRLTVGFGLCIDPDVPGAGITREEAATILRMRLMRLQGEVASAVPGFYDHPDPVQQALVEASYQMGVAGLLGFKKMLQALEARDYEAAADEGLDSKWANQTPARAKKVTDMIRSAAHQPG
jgi:lysozyme